MEKAGLPTPRNFLIETSSQIQEARVTARVRFFSFLATHFGYKHFQTYIVFLSLPRASLSLPRDVGWQ
jgi:hypothetical protein